MFIANKQYWNSVEFVTKWDFSDFFLIKFVDYLGNLFELFAQACFVQFVLKNEDDLSSGTKHALVLSF